MNFMFYTSSVLALLSIAILMGMPETLPNKVRFRPGLLRISRHDIYEPKVFPAAFVTLLTSFAYGPVLTITPDESSYLGISNKGLFFTVFTVSSLATRFLAGKFSDRLGRVPVLKASSLALGLSMVMTGLAHSPAVFLASAVAYGIAIGTNSPTLSAWTIDLSQEAFRGRPSPQCTFSWKSALAWAPSCRRGCTTTGPTASAGPLPRPPPRLSSPSGTCCGTSR
jgi:hypothetical protein